MTSSLGPVMLNDKMNRCFMWPRMLEDILQQLNHSQVMVSCNAQRHDAVVDGKMKRRSPLLQLDDDETDLDDDETCNIYFKNSMFVGQEFGMSGQGSSIAL